MLGENKNYENLRILEANSIKQTEMKEKIEILQKSKKKKILGTKLCSRNPAM